MWVWEVHDEVEPISLFIIKPLGVTSTLCLGLLCYARGRGLGFERIHERCESYLYLWVNLRWLL